MVHDADCSLVVPAVLLENQSCNEVALNGVRSWTIICCHLDLDADQILHLIQHHLSLSYFQIKIEYYCFVLPEAF